MPEFRGMQPVRGFANDVIAWCVVPAVFLFVYVTYHAMPRDAIGSHFVLVLIAFLAVTLARIALWRLVSHKHVARLLTSCVISAALVVVVLYYSLVLIGLHSWARVVSWELITSYTAQLPELLDSLGLTLHYVAAIFACLYAVLVYFVHAYLRRHDWIPYLLAETSGRMQVFIFIGGLAICATAVYHFNLTPPVQKAEPLSLTFFPLAVTKDFQGHAIDQLRADRLDRREDEARSSYVTNPEAMRRNLVIIVVDALRPDHMGIYGYERNTTPNIARLVESGSASVIRNVRASCADSSCGLLSMASSKFVHQFSNRPFTLQQALRRHGYRVEMILGGDHTNFYGLKALYGELDSYYDGSVARGYYVNDDQLVLDHMGKLAAWDGKPVMMQFHLMSAHVLGKRHERFAKYAPSGNYIVPGNRTGEHRDSIRNFYDNGVLQADAYIHSLLAILREKGYLKDALVVITADHGEALGEHGHYAHANSVREEALRIPLVFIPFGYRSNFALESNVALTQADIAPSILSEFGIPIPATWSGVPIQQSRQNRYSFFQEGLAGGVIDHRDAANVWKYWFDARDGREYAFNLSRDPAEKNNVIHHAPPDLRREWRLQQMQLMPGMQLREKLVPETAAER